LRQGNNHVPVRSAPDDFGSMKKEPPMKKVILLPIAAAAFALSACSDKAQNETGEAADAVAADVNSTMGEAVDDVDAASERAFDDAENGLDRAGRAIENTADDAGRAIDRGADDAGRAIDRGADDAKRDTGRELERVGNDLQR
jgi:hypothetical protein